MITKPKILFGLFLAGIAILTVSIYWQGLNGPFLLDDNANIEATYISIGEFDWNKVIYALSHNGSGALGRPVSILSFTFSGLMHGPSPWGYKFHNVLIHLVNGLLIFWLLARIISHLDKNLNPERRLLIAVVVSACWVLHPLMVSTVLYAVQRMTELSGLFTLLALIVYVISRENTSNKNKLFYFGLYFLFPIFLVLAMLSKENGALIPFYVFAIELIVFQFAYKDPVEKKKVFCFFAIFVLIPVILGTLYVMTHFSDLTRYSIRSFNLYERLLTETHVIFFYLKLILLPQLSDMSLFHDDFVVIKEFDLLTLFYSLIILTAAMLVFVLRKRAPFISFGLAWFLISHLMESTFFDLELVFEHRNYLAVLGLMLPIFYYLLRSPKYKWAEYSAYCFFLVLAVLTTFRVQEWKSEEMIYLVALEDHPESVRVHSEYANISYYSGKFDRAIEHLQIVQELQPNEAAPVIHEILMLCTRDLPLESKLNEAKKRLTRYPVTPYTLSTIDLLVIAKNDKEVCSEIQIKDILEMVQIASKQENNAYLAMLQRLEGILYFMRGESSKGAEYLERSYQLNGRVATLFDLADVQLRYEQIDDLKLTIEQLDSINDSSLGAEEMKLAALKERYKDKQRR